MQGMARPQQVGGGLESATILVVDDTPVHGLQLQRILREAGCHNVVLEADPWKVVDVVATAEPQVIFLDLNMPQLDGFGVMQLIAKEIAFKVPIPILVSVTERELDLRQRAIASGAFDIVGKPFDPVEVAVRARNALHHRLLATQVETGNVELEALVRARTEELDAAQVAMLEKLALAAEYRDDDTGGHARRVGDLSADIARALGVSPGITEMIRLAAPLHDLGKVGIPDRILLKPGALDAEEMEVMKTHTTIGARIVSGSHPVLWLAAQICATHHERWDGSGYPAGLTEEDIPLPGRIVAVADVFETLLAERPYRKSWPRHRAIAELLTQSTRQFDPRIVEAFLRVERGDADPRRRPSGTG
ncbi:MAG TPA: HD domain-containing phosphohydrolase [Candidatus Dormibacteraeota bacterium]|nr:HD domain-containing phosphohydrolase [Candidatus Dormibacteraeota bacterium]